jgi:hypothetical protein
MPQLNTALACPLRLSTFWSKMIVTCLFFSEIPTLRTTWRQTDFYVTFGQWPTATIARNFESWASVKGFRAITILMAEK